MQGIYNTFSVISHFTIKTDIDTLAQNRRIHTVL